MAYGCFGGLTDVMPSHQAAKRRAGRMLDISQAKEFALAHWLAGGTVGRLPHGTPCHNHTDHQGTWWPLWSKKPPLLAGVKRAKTASNSRAAVSASRTSSPAFAKGAESEVATVPGCNATQMACGRLRASSMAAVRRGGSGNSDSPMSGFLA
jgi:hypothetical protein